MNAGYEISGSFVCCSHSAPFPSSGRPAATIRPGWKFPAASAPSPSREARDNTARSSAGFGRSSDLQAQALRPIYSPPLPDWPIGQSVRVCDFRSCSPLRGSPGIAPGSLFTSRIGKNREQVQYTVVVGVLSTSNCGSVADIKRDSELVKHDRYKEMTTADKD